jgi:predicted RecB family nuclease
MKRNGTTFDLTATDLVGYLNCRHLSDLDRAVAEGSLPKPKTWDPLLEVLRERGALHEMAFIDHLRSSGLDVVHIEGAEISAGAIAQTLEALRRGVPVVVQGALSYGSWGGRADVLRRVEKPSRFGAWSYEVIDTKLARETKAGSILQLCVYSDLLSHAQDLTPEYMHIVAPWTDFAPQRYRFADYAAYFRRVQKGLMVALADAPSTTNYPDPKEHCEVCRWAETCDKRRRSDDHLCLVAGITKVQINELKTQGVTTAKGLAALSLPLPWKPERGSLPSYNRIREQARIQIQARETGQKAFELLPVEPDFGFTRLPAPSRGDIFLDLEGDPFVGEHGLEYLLGYLTKDAAAQDRYHHYWAFTRAHEKRALEDFVDLVMERWQQFPDLHIYHYAPYEPAALKRLMGRYATREEEIDRMLHAHLFVDLYQIVRHAIRASVESYSIKQLEAFYGFERNTPLSQANSALFRLQACLEVGDASAIEEDAKSIVRDYNAEDCRSAFALRDWLEAQRSRLIAEGAEILRPDLREGVLPDNVSAWLQKIEPLIARLAAGVPPDPAERTPDQQGRWILAHILDFHRREQKSAWWEYFRLSALSAEELLEERPALSGLQYIGDAPPLAGSKARVPIHRYRFPLQDTDLRGDEDLRSLGGEPLGTVDAIDFENRTIDIKKQSKTAGVHPEAVFAHKIVGTKELSDSLVRIAEYVADHGLSGEGPYQAARDLLLKAPPRTGGEPLMRAGATTHESALWLCRHLGSGILPIQGPPGAGKTVLAANMIEALVGLGKIVGITANSHKVIRNLVDESIKYGTADRKSVDCCVKSDEPEPARPHLAFARKNDDLLSALGQTAQVGGGTAWLWASPDAADTLDVLFVDEAAQMSLANVLAASPAARTIVLVGDPQQLDQPIQGCHPEGTDVSALGYILDGAHTIPPEKGFFLDQTWRMNPAITTFTSELFYDGKLRSRKSLERQTIRSDGPVTGAGLRYLPVPHKGNQNCSAEEAQVVKDLVQGILHGHSTWADRDGVERPVTLADILIIAPYNAQVFEIQQLLPGARVGTVDKFQGQEAPIAIYSTATSSHADAPRGMEFLYSLNRLNVATTRAKCVSVLVSSPQLFEAHCRTPRHIQLANAFCRYVESAQPIAP